MGRVLLIRHGKTQSNLERRYIGSPDEPLCEVGIREAEAMARGGLLPPIETLYCGPALRCRQTAEVLFPGKQSILCPFSEIDFGVFKGKNADDLLGDTDYEKWLETNCMGDIPGGDSVAAFKELCCEAFLRIMAAAGGETVGMILHGGNIMAILERLAVPKQDFYAYHVSNCGFFLCRYDHGTLAVERKGGTA